MNKAEKAATEKIKSLKNTAIKFASTDQYSGCCGIIDECINKTEKYGIDKSILENIIDECYISFMDNNHFDSAESFSIKYKKYIDTENTNENKQNESKVSTNSDKDKIEPIEQEEISLNSIIVFVLTIIVFFILLNISYWYIAIILTILFPIVYVNFGKLVYIMSINISEKYDKIFQIKNKYLLKNTVINRRLYIGTFWPIIFFIFIPLGLISILIGNLFVNNIK